MNDMDRGIAEQVCRIFCEWETILLQLERDGRAGDTQTLWEELGKRVRQHWPGATVRDWADGLERHCKLKRGAQTVETLGRAWELLQHRMEEKSQRDRPHADERYLVDVMDRLLDHHYQVPEALRQLGQVTPRPGREPFRVRVDLFGPDRTSAFVPGERLYLRLEVEPQPGWDDLLDVYVLQRDGPFWHPLFPNRFDHEGHWLVPGVPFWIPDEGSNYELVALEKPQLKVIVTTDAVAFPLHVRRVGRAANPVARQREFRIERRQALEALYQRWQQCPGRFSVVEL